MFYGEARTMKPKIGLITLGVSDLARSLRFYRDGLGFPTHNYKADEGIVVFKMEGSWLALYPRDKLAEDATVPAAGSGFGGITLAHNAGTKEEVNQVMELAVSAGARMVKKPQDVFWGGYSGYFADPDGHLWEVAFNPFTDLT
jgi:catechol 2,3-dioxygenase-like lactoylglutathione lyase family enzyme